VPYSTLAAPATSRVEIKKSVFLGVVAPISGIEAADALIASQRKEHYSARHHCTAMILGEDGEIQRSNDDGEPSGSAGLPMLTVLRHHNLTDVVAVVTRYFGGTLLGVGGLIRAYTDAVNLALEGASFIHYTDGLEFQVVLPFAVAGDLEHLLRTWASANGAQIADVQYGSDQRVTVHLPVAADSSFAELTASWPAKGAQVERLGPVLLKG
jgi:uncharacterized YigZ family protein